MPNRMPSPLDHVRSTFAHTPRTLALVWRSSRATTVALGAMTLVAALLPLVVAWVGKQIVDAVVGGDKDVAIHWVAIELGVVAVQALVQRGLGLARQVLGSRLALDINMQILEKAQELELAHFEDPEFYDRLTRARREASSRPVSVVNETFQLLQNTLTLAGYIALLVGFSTWAVLGLVIAAVPAAIAEMKFSHTAYRMRHWRSPETRKLGYLEYLLANDGHAKEVKVLGIGPHLLDRYRVLGEGFYEEDRRLAVRRTGWAYSLSLFATGAFYGCYVAMVGLAATRKISIGELTLYVAAFRHGQLAFQSCLSALGGMYEDNLYMSNLFAYFAIPTGRAAKPGEIAPLVETTQTASASGATGLRLEGVGFRYPGREEWALRGVELDIPRGRSLALVGQNGAGKSTMIKLLTRLYEPTEGRILLDGKDLRAWDLATLHRRLGVVFQDFNQYQLRVRDNVGLGSVDHLGDDAQVGRAVERGGATEVVAKLAGGLDAQLGRWFKDGTELSGGQWQKLALARAFMREEADILVLDEPTAALDAEAEHAIFERFRRLAEGRTAILISHRFPTVRMADRIVVLDGGRIVEDGTHDELVAAGGRYARLFTLQAQGYA